MFIHITLAGSKFSSETLDLIYSHENGPITMEGKGEGRGGGRGEGAVKFVDRGIYRCTHVPFDARGDEAVFGGAQNAYQLCPISLTSRSRIVPGELCGQRAIDKVVTHGIP